MHLSKRKIGAIVGLISTLLWICLTGIFLQMLLFAQGDYVTHVFLVLASAAITGLRLHFLLILPMWSSDYMKAKRVASSDA